MASCRVLLILSSYKIMATPGQTRNLTDGGRKMSGTTRNNEPDSVREMAYQAQDLLRVSNVLQAGGAGIENQQQR
jgi:hypothetical protein